MPTVLMKFGADAGDDPLATVKGFITSVINTFQAGRRRPRWTWIWTSVSAQAPVALVICALDCDHAQPRTGDQIWSQASQVKKSRIWVLRSTLPNSTLRNSQLEITLKGRAGSTSTSQGLAGFWELSARRMWPVPRFSRQAPPGG